MMIEKKPSRHPKLIASRFIGDNSLLHAACGLDHVDIVVWFISQSCGGRLGQSARGLRTPSLVHSPLHLAATGELAELLLDHGVKMDLQAVNAVDRFLVLMTPLDRACFHGLECCLPRHRRGSSNSHKKMVLQGINQQPLAS